jgi:hypothetical protein
VESADDFNPALPLDTPLSERMVDAMFYAPAQGSGG